MKRLINKKGMTLVEVIVVLVILAILAAILVPTMIGWINKAKKETHAAEARAVYLAAQTLASERFAKEGNFEVNYSGNDADPDDDFVTAVLELADANGNLSYLKIVNGEVIGLIYEEVKIGVIPVSTPSTNPE